MHIAHLKASNPLPSPSLKTGERVEKGGRAAATSSSLFMSDIPKMSPPGMRSTESWLV